MLEALTGLLNPIEHISAGPWPREDSSDAALQSVDVGGRRYQRRRAFADSHDTDLGVSLHLLDELRQALTHRLKRRIQGLAVVDEQNDVERGRRRLGAKHLACGAILAYLEIRSLESG